MSVESEKESILDSEEIKNEQIHTKKEKIEFDKKIVKEGLSEEEELKKPF